MIRYLFVLLAAAGLACTPCHAQEEPPPPPEAEDPPPHRRTMEHPSQRQNGPLERFMGQLAQENPEEFARLKKLREQDPGRLHEILQGRRDQLRAQQLLKGLAELPRFREVIESLNPEERAQLQEKFRRFVGGKMDGRKTMRRPQNDRRPGKESENQLRQLTRKFREAPEDEKEELRVQIRSNIETSFEQGEAERRRNIEEVEGRLEKLKKILSTRAQNREQIIERRRLELTDGDPMKW